MALSRALLVVALAAWCTLAAAQPVDVVIAQFYELQNSGACIDFVDLFAANFTVSDGGSSAEPIVDRDVLLRECAATQATFRLVNISLRQATQISASQVAVQWRCARIFANWRIMCPAC